MLFFPAVRAGGPMLLTEFVGHVNTATFSFALKADNYRQ